MKLENKFSVTHINLATFDYPKVEVHTWSDVFNAGGSVDVECKTPEGHRLTLYSEKIEENRDVSDEREYAQELADDWNQDCENNWKAELLRCFKSIADYEQKQIDALAEHEEKLAKYQECIKQLEPTAAQKEVE